MTDDVQSGEPQEPLFFKDMNRFENFSKFFEPICRAAHLTIKDTLKHCVELNNVCQYGELMTNGDLEDSDDVVSEFVRAKLKDRYGPVPGVPPERDRQILADAKRHFAEHGPAALRPLRRRVSAWQWAAMGSTIAAACVVFLTLRPEPDQSVNIAMNSDAANSDAIVEASMLVGDIDRNGRVDILDAFAMAREMRDGRSGFRDVNGDGRFDQADIDLVTREAVKL